MGLFNPPITQSIRSTTTTTSDVTAVATSTTLLTANSARIGAVIWNKSISDLYIDFDAAVTTSSFAVKVAADGYYELPFHYTGIISGMWDTADGKATIREFV